MSAAGNEHGARLLDVRREGGDQHGFRLGSFPLSVDEQRRSLGRNLPRLLTDVFNWIIRRVA